MPTHEQRQAERIRHGLRRSTKWMDLLFGAPIPKTPPVKTSLTENRAEKPDQDAGNMTAAEAWQARTGHPPRPRKPKRKRRR